MKGPKVVMRTTVMFGFHIHCLVLQTSAFTLILNKLCSGLVTAKTHQRSDAYPLFGERRQSSAVSEGAACSPGEHGLPRHCGWKPSSDFGPHMDHNPPLPGDTIDL